MLITLVGSTVLGITLLVKRFRPWPPAALLAAAFPLALVITTVTSMGSVALPIMFAFAMLGRRIATSPPSSTGAGEPLASAGQRV